MLNFIRDTAKFSITALNIAIINLTVLRHSIMMSDIGLNVFYAEYRN
jgi:hypothetical protein